MGLITTRWLREARAAPWCLNHSAESGPGSRETMQSTPASIWPCPPPRSRRLRTPPRLPSLVEARNGKTSKDARHMH
eukprot:10419544-Heterocapsa_arctica.AAC.1